MNTLDSQQTDILDELIDNASGLPVESQNLLLLLAKSMAYTRDCLTKQNISDK